MSVVRKYPTPKSGLYINAPPKYAINVCPPGPAPGPGPDPDPGPDPGPAPSARTIRAAVCDAALCSGDCGLQARVMCYMRATRPADGRVRTMDMSSRIENAEGLARAFGFPVTRDVVHRIRQLLIHLSDYQTRGGAVQPPGAGACAVCLEDTPERERLILVPCRHWVCVRCSTKIGQCPHCRSDVDARYLLWSGSYFE